MSKKEFKSQIKSLRGNKFLIEYIHPFTQKRVRNRFKTYREAVAYQKELEHQYKEHPENPYLDMKLSNLINLHLEECPNSRMMDRKNNFLDFYNTFSEMKLKEINVHLLKKWFEKRKKENDYSDLTLIHIRGNLNHFFGFLVDLGALMVSPLAQVRFNRNPPPKRARVYLMEDELRLILDNAKEYSPKFLYPVFYTLIHTGARRQEVFNLKWSNIDFSRGTVTFVETKNGTNRTIKMSDNLYKFIQSWPKINEWVFNNPTGGQIRRSQFGRHHVSFKNAYPNGKDWRCHSIRHSFAYNFLLKGGHMYELQAILGHKSIHMTIDLYGNLRAEDVENPSPFNL